jgi:hypothetical protein
MKLNKFNCFKNNMENLFQNKSSIQFLFFQSLNFFKFKFIVLKIILVIYNNITCKASIMTLY